MSLHVLVVLAAVLVSTRSIQGEPEELNQDEEENNEGISDALCSGEEEQVSAFTVLVVMLTFGLCWFRWRFVNICQVSFLSTVLWIALSITGDANKNKFFTELTLLILFLGFFIYSSHQHERSLRKEFKTRRNDSFKVQVLQEKVEALQTGNEKEDEQGLDMTGRAEKALGVLQVLAENPHLSAEDQKRLLLVKKTLLSNETYEVDVKRQLAQGKGAGMHSEMQHWLSSAFKSGIKYNVDERSSSEKANAEKAGQKSFFYGEFDSLLSDSNITFDSEEVFENWDVDVFKHCETLGSKLKGSGCESPFVFTMVNLFKRHDLEQAFSIPSHALYNFMLEVEHGYLDNPYHNSFHAMDVTLSLHYIITQGGLAKIYSTLDMFACLVAAVSHDVEHVGRNNNFMIETNHKLALRYNDTAVMENHHAAFVFFLSKYKNEAQRAEDGVVPQDLDCDIFQGLDREQYKLIRKIIIDCILSTDLGAHFSFMAKFNATTTSEDFNASSKRNRMLLLQGAIKMSDVGHTSKGPENHGKWTERIMEEFFQQGDHEKQLRVTVSAFMDREKMVNQKGICQEGFLNYVVMPLFKSWTSVFPESQLLLNNLQTNFEYWKNMAELEKAVSK